MSRAAETLGVQQVWSCGEGCSCEGWEPCLLSWDPASFIAGFPRGNHFFSLFLPLPFPLLLCPESLQESQIPLEHAKRRLAGTSALHLRSQTYPQATLLAVMDLGGNVERWEASAQRGEPARETHREICWAPCSLPLFSVDSCLLQSTFQELFSSQFGIFERLLFVPNEHHQVLSSTVTGELEKCLEQNLEWVVSFGSIAWPGNWEIQLESWLDSRNLKVFSSPNDSVASKKPLRSELHIDRSKFKPQLCHLWLWPFLHPSPPSLFLVGIQCLLPWTFITPKFSALARWRQNKILSLYETAQNSRPELTRGSKTNSNYLAAICPLLSNLNDSGIVSVGVFPS